MLPNPLPQQDKGILSLEIQVDVEVVWLLNTPS